VVTATYHGLLKLWTSDGQLIASARKHKGPIFSASWNSKDTVLLTSGFDKTIIAWSVPQLEVQHIYSHHSASVLEVDWKDDLLFASCSRDKTLCIASVDDRDYLLRLDGHINEINTISWSPDRKILASCSDDKTIKCWRIEEPHLVADLKGHSKEVYTIDWSPSGPNSPNPDLPLVIASYTHYYFLLFIFVYLSAY
jgi:transducin (beta)-like 1